MKISIVIPVLNEEKYVGILLDCLAHQTHDEFEVLVIDGGSQDKTKEVVMPFAEKIPLSFIEAPKKGVSFQRNYGVSKAKHDHIIFFDADVIIEDDFIERISDYLNDHLVDILTCWMSPISKRVSDRVGFWFYNAVYVNGLKDISPCSVGAFMYVKKESFEKIGGFDEAIILAEDYDLVTRMFKAGYRYKFLKNPKFGFSVRRLDKMGRLPYFKEMFKAGLLYHTKGGIKDSSAIYYPMGNTDEIETGFRFKKLDIKIKPRLPKLKLGSKFK